MNAATRRLLRTALFLGTSLALTAITAGSALAGGRFP
jgi:hypothetical protein